MSRKKTTPDAEHLAAIVASPDDDAPRLVYADVLLTRGDPRGELIAVQCELASNPPHERREALRARERTLLEAGARVWAKTIVRLGASNPRFERGFVGSATMTVASFAEKGGAVLDAEPFLRSMSLIHATPRVFALLPPCETLSRLSALTLRKVNLTYARARQLFASPHLGALRALELGENPIRGGGARALAQSKMRALEDVGLAYCSIYDVGAEHLASAPWALRRLDLSGNLLRRFPRPTFAETLESLELAANPLGEEGVRSLAGIRLPRLRRLGLHRITFDGPKAAEALVPLLGTLRDLDLSYNRIGDAGAALLASSALELLDVSECAIGDAGAKALAAIPTLTWIRVAGNPIGTAGRVALAKRFRETVPDHFERA